MNIKSQILPIDRKNVDTDLIIPADYLKGTTKSGLGQYLFFRLRKSDPQFPINLSKYSGSQILVAQDNFGCGSSREHAVWALKDWGIKAIIAPSFADIFYSNALNNGLLPIVLPDSIIEKMIAAEKQNSGNYQLSINVDDQIVTLPDADVLQFSIDPYKKYCLLNGMEDIDYLLENINAINDFENERDKFLFYNISQIS